MLNLIKHLKPFTWSIVIIFGLLFGQAMADLALPGYMSDIVNTGIQNHGIENAVPEALSAAEFQRVNLFMTAESKALAAENYQLLDKTALSADDYAKYVKDYPGLADEPIYILNNNDEDTIKRLNSIFGMPIAMVYTLEKQGASAIPGLAEAIPEGADPFVVIAQIPQEQMDLMLTQMSSALEVMPATTITQSAAAYLSEQYEATGLNLISIQTGYIVRLGGMMLLITLLGAAAALATGYLSAKVAAGLGRNMRQQIFTRVESFSNAEFDRFSTASLITRSTNDITQVQMLLVMLFRIIFYAPIIGVGGIIKVVNSGAGMTWIIAVAVAAIMMMIGIMLIVAVPKFKIVQKLVDKLNLVTREILSGLMVIRAFNTQKHEEAKFDAANRDLTKISLFLNRIMVLLMPVMMLVMNIVMILIVWVGAVQVDNGSTQVGDLMAFMQYAMQIIMSFFMVSMVFVMLPRAIVSVQRINEVLQTKPAVIDPKDPKRFDGVKGQIEFRNVSFRYPGAEEDLLKNLTFTIKPGQTAAIIGSTGSGKSTLINLIPRFYDATGGDILVNGINIREVTQHDLREKIGYVSQKTLLFSGTIESNIKYANENATQKDMEKYAGTAQALDFINKSEKGFATAVAQGGSNLSGGQKQRLSIARALAKQPEIFIFDDSFSALDYTTDAALRKALRQETGHATVLIVTQRISTVMRSEQIIVLDKGEIVGIGTHADLLENCEVYREIAQSQLTKEELAS